MKTQHKSIFIIPVITFAIIMAMLFTAVYPSAAIINDSTLDNSRRGSLYIEYEDVVEGKDPIGGAEFTAYKVAVIDDEGSYASIIPSISEFKADMDMDSVYKKVKKAYKKKLEFGKKYKTTTGANGLADIQGMELGLYLVAESKAAIEHFATEPFFASLPYTEGNAWQYELSVVPKALPGGDIKITKTVTGNSGDRDRYFHFTVNINGYANQPIHYTKSNKEEGTIVSGEDIALKSGEYARLDTIPVGKTYSITEREANSDGYVTTSYGTEGQVYRKTVGDVSFTNSKSTTVQTGDSYRYLIAGGIALLCLILVIILLIVNRRKREKENNG